MLAPHPHLTAELSRRRVLSGGGRGLLALALLGTSISANACGPGKPPGPDPLEAQLDSARRDSDLAAAAAKAAPRPVVPALMVIADERARHASALVEELARAAGRHRRGLASRPETQGGRKDPLGRRVEFQRGTNGASDLLRSHHLIAAALFDPAS